MQNPDYFPSLPKSCTESHNGILAVSFATVSAVLELGMFDKYHILQLCLL